MNNIIISQNKHWENHIKSSIKEMFLKLLSTILKQNIYRYCKV